VHIHLFLPSTTNTNFKAGKITQQIPDKEALHLKNPNLLNAPKKNTL
jgi:hypothetical protein